MYRTFVLATLALFASATTLPAQRPTADQPNQAARSADQQVTPEVAAWLALGNHSEIELGKFALNKTTNKEVKQFAQRMIDEHSLQLKQLQQFTPIVNTTNTDGVQESTRTENSTNAAEATRPSNQHHSPMLRIARQAAANELQLTQQMLEKYEGQNFDMGYLGQQICAHIQMLAVLHAVKDVGDEKFQKSVTDSITSTKEHLQHAQQLARKFEDREQGSQPRPLPRGTE